MNRCVHCSHRLHTGEGKVIVSLTADELDELIFATSNQDVANRLLCALGLIDEGRERAVRAEMSRQP